LNVFKSYRRLTMAVVTLYILYLAACAVLTIVVASALKRSSRVVMTAILGDELLADAVSRLLVVAVYLLNLGYVALTLGAIDHVTSPGQAVRVLSVKVGEELLVLGGLHLASILVLARIRRRIRPPSDEPKAPGPWVAPRQRARAGAP
jgi:hypothetical protein